MFAREVLVVHTKSGRSANDDIAIVGDLIPMFFNFISGTHAKGTAVVECIKGRAPNIKPTDLHT